MTLAPSGTVVLGNLQYATHVSEIDVELRPLPGVGCFRVVLPRDVEMNAGPGDRGELTLDGGEGGEKVVVGKVRSIQRTLERTEVFVADGSADLAQLRPAATYNKQSAAQVIRGLAEDANVDVDQLELTLSLAAFVAHQRRTAAEHIADLASLGGGVALFNPDNKLAIKSLAAARAEMALKFGREIRSYRVRKRPPPPRQVRIGNGGSGATDAPEALRPSAGFLPGDAPEPGPGAVWWPSGLLRTPRAATEATRAASAAADRRSTTLKASAFLLPKLRPGTAIEVQELPEGHEVGPWLVTRVRHRLGPRCGETWFEATAVGNGEGLLGAALSLLGGLS